LRKQSVFLKKSSLRDRPLFGDSLEEVRKEIVHSGIKGVEVHLFSDLEETSKGKIFFPNAVQRLDKTLESELKNLDTAFGPQKAYMGDLGNS